MHYLVLLTGDGEERPWADQSPEEQAAAMESFASFERLCRDTEGVRLLAGAGLDEPSTATTVRWSGGRRVVTEGPYAEALEGLGGMYLLEAPSLDVLLTLTERLPRYDLQVTPVTDVV